MARQSALGFAALILALICSAVVSKTLAQQPDVIDPLSKAFSEVAQPVRTFSMNGCTPALPNPFANAGVSLVVRCDQSLRMLNIQDFQGAESDFNDAPVVETPHCPGAVFVRPRVYVDGPNGTVVFLCEGEATRSQHGRHLPIYVSRAWAPSSQLIVPNDAATAAIEGAHFAPARGMDISGAGDFIILTADIGRERVAVVIDIERRILDRILRASDLPVAGMPSGYFDVRAARFVGDSTAVVASVGRASGRASYTVNTLVKWSEGGAIDGIDLMEYVDFPSQFSNSYLRESGLIPVGVQWQVFPDGVEHPTNRTNGFRAFAFARRPLRSERAYSDPAWLDPRDMWFGDTAQAQTRYAIASGPIHCEVQASDRMRHLVVLGRQLSVQPFATRLFSEEASVNCATDPTSSTLAVWGSSGTVHIYRLNRSIK